MATFTIGKNIPTSEVKSNEKFIVYKGALISEVIGDSQHFLRVGGITASFLTGPEPSSPENDSGVNSATGRMLRKAIWQFYQVFDYASYSGFKNPKGLVTKIVWAKFRALQNIWLPGHNSHLISLGIASKKIYDADRARGHLKRQEKEKQQMLILGDGDLDKGRDKFVNRMRVQKEVKLNKDNDVPLATMTEFSKWLMSDEAKSYNVRMVDAAPKQFSLSSYHGIPDVNNNINLKVKSISGVIDALRQLSLHPNARELSIEAMFSWDEKVEFSNPATHTYPANSPILALSNSGRIIQNEKMKICGFVQVNGKSYVVSTKTSSVYRLFPKKFVKLESKNPKTCSVLSILYSVDHSLSGLRVEYKHTGRSYVMNINILSTGKDVVNACEIFTAYDPISLIKTQTADAISRLQKIKDEQARKSKMDGLAKATAKKKPDSTDQILKLCDAFNSGLLTKSQFETAKNNLFS